MTPSVAILTRLRALIDADGRSPETLSVAMGLSRAYLRRRLAAGDGLRLADLDVILGALGVDLSALVGAPPLSIPERDECSILILD